MSFNGFHFRFFFASLFCSTSAARANAKILNSNESDVVREMHMEINLLKWLISRLNVLVQFNFLFYFECVGSLVRSMLCAMREWLQVVRLRIRTHIAQCPGTNYSRSPLLSILLHMRCAELFLFRFCSWNFFFGVIQMVKLKSSVWNECVAQKPAGTFAHKNDETNERNACKKLKKNFQDETEYKKKMFAPNMWRLN